MQRKSEASADQRAEAGELDAKLRQIVTHVVAVAWGLGGVLVLVQGESDFRFVGILVSLLAIAFTRWPTVVRWPMVALVTLPPLGFAVFASSYFHVLLNWPLALKGGLGAASHLLLLFGRITIPRLVVGSVAFVVYVAMGSVDPREDAAIPPQTCEKRVADLNRRLTPFVTDQRYHWNLNAAKVPILRKGNRAAASRPILEVARTGKWFGEPLPDDPTNARDELKARIERLRPIDPDGPGPFAFYVAADAALRVQEIAALLEPLHEVRALLLAQARDERIGSPPPGAQAFARDFENARDDGELARILADNLGRRAGPCAALSSRLQEIQRVPPETKAAFLVKSFDEGLRECRCGWVDVDALEYVAVRALSGRGIEHLAIPLSVDANGKLVLPSERGLTVEHWMQRL